jgi:hypothetical protein
VTDQEIEDFKVFTFWLPKDKSTAVYNKVGHSYSINTYIRKLESITNTPDKGLDVRNYYQVIQKEHGK